MRVAVIGGTGHVGTYLVPRLVELGHDVVCISRGKREPYRQDGAWARVQRVLIDREEAEAAGDFGRRIADLGADVVIDMVCFRLESARHLVDALYGEVQHFLHTGTIWVHGPKVEAPTTEQQPRRHFGEYGPPYGAYGLQKAAIESYLLDQARRRGLPATVVHPGHTEGSPWEPVNPVGSLKVEVFGTLARG